jgi:hypothetical protein
VGNVFVDRWRTVYDVGVATLFERLANTAKMLTFPMAYDYRPNHRTYMSFFLRSG